MRTYIYVDGFNLYYGVLRNTRWKWLDLPALFANVLKPHHDIVKVKYFTARVSGSPTDKSAPRRQNVYLHALQNYRPEVDVYYGQFMTHKIRAPLVEPIANQRVVEVFRTEEKGTDVNLAVHLLNDSWLDLYDCAVVVSNDSDLAEGMRLVKEHRNKKIGLVTPGRRHPSKQLRAHADFSRKVRPSALKLSQLPDRIPGTSFSKPPEW